MEIRKFRDGINALGKPECSFITRAIAELPKLLEGHTQFATIQNLINYSLKLIAILLLQPPACWGLACKPPYSALIKFICDTGS